MGGWDQVGSGQDRPLIKFPNINEVAYLSGMPHFPELWVQVDKITVFGDLVAAFGSLLCPHVTH